MTSNRIVCGIAALSMAFSGMAFAQNDLDARADRAGRANLQGRPGVEGLQERERNAAIQQRNERRDNDRRGYERRGYDQRSYDQRSYDQRDYGRWNYEQRDHRGYDHRGWGAGPEHNFYRGGRLPDYYRGREYVVDDWRGHHLHAPPRGYHWVQVGPDYVLVAVATGIIASILLNQ
jgi:Ni/Co efflux regulator RcnB